MSDKLNKLVSDALASYSSKRVEIAATKKNTVASKMSKEELLNRIAGDAKETEKKLANLADQITSLINLARNPTQKSYEKLEVKLEGIKKYLTPTMGSPSPLHNIMNVLEDLHAIKNMKKK